jgi:hypothetical protein
MFLIIFKDEHGKVIGSLTPEQFRKGVDAPKTAFLQTIVDKYNNNRKHGDLKAEIVLAKSRKSKK